MNHLNPLTEQLQPVTSALQEALGDDLVALVLFGSRARGDARPDSDWDLLLIAEGLPERPFARHLALKKVLPPLWRGAIALLTKTPTEFESAVPSLFLDIALDGLILYDKQNYAHNHLHYLRQLLRKKGLSRHQKGREFIWQWQTFPSHNWQLAWREKV